MNARGHLVDHQLAARQLEEFQGDQALHRPGFGHGAGDAACPHLRFWAAAGRIHAAAQNAVYMQVLDQRAEAHVAVRAARHAQADLAHKGDQPLQHAGHAAQLGPGGAQLGLAAHPRLPVAVVAQLGGFQDALATDPFECARQIGPGFDQSVRRGPGPGSLQRDLLAAPVFAQVQHGGRGTQRKAARKQSCDLHGHVLELQRHGAALGQSVQCSGVGVRGMQVFGAQPGRGQGVRFQHHASHAQRQGGQRQHLRQLPAA